MIYFLQNQTTGEVKIGYSKDPYKRMKNVKYDRGNDRTHVYKPLFVSEGSFELEAEIQHAYRRFCSRGEWFRISKRDIYKIAATFNLFLQ